MMKAICLLLVTVIDDHKFFFFPVWMALQDYLVHLRCHINFKMNTFVIFIHSFFCVENRIHQLF
jgi:hypothetical protein